RQSIPAKKIFTPFIIFFTCLSQNVNAQFPLRFCFGKYQVGEHFRLVTDTTTYSDSRGYGLDYDSKVIAVARRKDRSNIQQFITSKAPFYFSAKIPEGNYLVKIKLGDKQGNSITTIKTENRRLLEKLIRTNDGQIIEVEFTIHIRDSIIHPSGLPVKLKPRERNYLHWDNKLTLEFGNEAPKLCTIEIIPDTTALTVFLAGNSTVVDQAEEPWAAWGQMIPSFFKPQVCIANYAESGETLKAFQHERRLEKIWSMAKPGDYLFIEFAHNDQKPGGNHLGPFTSYTDTLKRWIEEARKRNVHPVLITSMHRRSFDSLGQIINTLSDYPEAVRKTAHNAGIPMIDLNFMSKTLYEALGPEKSKRAFVHYPANTFPNQPEALRDDTHFSTYGAYELAKCIVIGIRKELPELSRYLKDNITDFNPGNPAPYENWSLPQSSFIGSKKPDGN
ncbi:MAG: rhamnogalacturonan acetylesterase, partial [Chitinophagaceae bacterium]|nr:rhamnogalacturonan acetylesterase [Chitinophagaceae bacterium]